MIHSVTDHPRKAAEPVNPPAEADYRLGPRISIVFSDALPPNGDGWWCPEDQVMLVDRSLRGRELAITLLHEIGHIICGDHDEVLADEDHDTLDHWAESCARLLDLVRPGRRAAPA